MHIHTQGVHLSERMTHGRDQLELCSPVCVLEWEANEAAKAGDLLVHHYLITQPINLHLSGAGVWLL